MPEPPTADSDAEDEQEDEAVDADDNDVLADLPDDTEVHPPRFIP